MTEAKFKVIFDHITSMVGQIFSLLFAIAVYYIFRGLWNPVGFNPLSYWNLRPGEFWSTLGSLLPLLFFVALALGQLDWLKNQHADELEETTIQGAPLVFKLIRSVFAGVVEELSHRGYSIYIAMIMLALSNKILIWEIGFLLFIVWAGLSLRVAKKWFTVALGVVGVGAFIWLWQVLGPDPVYSFYQNITLPLYQIALSEAAPRPILQLVLVSVFALGSLIAVFAKLYLATASRDDIASKVLGDVYDWKAVLMSILGLGVTVFLWHEMLGAIEPQAILAVPLLYASAILTTVKWFRKGHQYQGLKGVINAWIFALYMQYIAFTYGLIYAIILHAVYDAILFASEHVVQKIKDFVRR